MDSATKVYLRKPYAVLLQLKVFSKFMTEYPFWIFTYGECIIGIQQYVFIMD